MHTNKNQNGFIPLVITILIVLGVIVWLSFKHVSDANKTKKVINDFQTSVGQNENLID